ncbi:hypothetical protein OPV22_027570 [Ensete ventricosum]|uniref:Uncharacterized protein n=1 Tax=Ensete ventricosum TaxID=4639 RepID=A0AAV8Q5R9_ENSVE|nr:hypothetical protein OPV22_027570 [Ensete ventricosum]
MIRGRREGGARQGQEDVSMFGASTTTSPSPRPSLRLRERVSASFDVWHNADGRSSRLFRLRHGRKKLPIELCFLWGRGDEGINLVMDRDHGMDGKLKDARCKFEVQKRWTDSYLVIC